MPKIKSVLKCGEDCTLKDECGHRPIHMEGNPKTAKILFIGEAPGDQEAKMGLSFVGQSGKLLRETLAVNKIVDFCLVNAVRCHPPKNRTPSAKEVQTCSQLFLVNDINSIPNLQLIVPLGNVALAAVLGQKYKSITKYSGKLLSVNGINYLPVYHPAYVLRNRNELKTFEEHVGRIPLALTGNLLDAADFGKYNVIRDITTWNTVVDGILETGYVVYDLETTGLSPFVIDNVIRCIGFSFVDREAWTLPMEGWTDGEWKTIKDDLYVIFASKRIGKIGHNVKFDNLWTEVRLGIPVNNTVWDTKMSQFLLNENESNELKDMAWKYTRIGGYEKLLNAEPQSAELNLLYTYCATDCDVTHRIYNLHRSKLSKELHYLMTNLMMPATNALVASEIKGIKLDMAQLDSAEAQVDVKMAQLMHSIRKEKSVVDYTAATGAFNPNSSMQLGEILFKYEGLKPVSHTKKTKRPSTNRAALEELSLQSNLCKSLVEYSLYSSLKSKMIKELREHAVNGRIHTFYSLTRTTTGRTASRNPNLQNVTKGAKDTVGIRKVFIADPDHTLVEFDMNQHELRCMAEIAKDDNLARALLSSDVHASTAASILGKRPEQVTPDERRNVGKTFNFGLIYGLTEHGVMRRLKCDEVTAKMYIAKFFAAYPKTKQWMDATSNYARQHGMVESLTGRVRHFPIWDELDDKSVREAINMPIQSLASDILLYGLIAVHKMLLNRRSYICLEVHDSIVCNIHKDEMDLVPKIQWTMENAHKNHIRFILPLQADVKIGPNWGELHDEEDEIPNEEEEE